MLQLDSPRWATFSCALGCVCDRRSLVRAFLRREVSAKTWDDAFNYIVYQEDIGEFSLAVAPYLVRFLKASDNIPWEPLSLLATIGIALRSRSDFAEDLIKGFDEAMSQIPTVLANHEDRFWDTLVTRCAVSCIALARGQAKLAEIYLDASFEELTEWRLSRDQHQ